MTDPHTIKSSDVRRCPVRSLTAGHYRPDGTCLCPGPGRAGHDDAPGLCETCAGTGRVERPGGDLGDLVKCPACNGSCVR